MVRDMLRAPLYHREGSQFSPNPRWPPARALPLVGPLPFLVAGLSDSSTRRGIDSGGIIFVIVWCVCVCVCVVCACVFVLEDLALYDLRRRLICDATQSCHNRVSCYGCYGIANRVCPCDDS